MSALFGIKWSKSQRFVFRLYIIGAVFAPFPAIAEYPGDRLLSIRQLAIQSDTPVALAAAKKAISEILDILMLSEDKVSYHDIDPNTPIIRDDISLLPGHLRGELVVVRKGSAIPYADSSIIVAEGALSVSHAGNDIIICGGDVDISHDNGSLVISRGIVTIAHASNTLVYAVGGIKISFPQNVRTFNTVNHDPSRARIGNTIVEPLFKKEKVGSPLNKSDTH